MASKIEKMNKMRRNILFIVFTGSLIAFSAFMYPSIYRLLHFRESPRFDASPLLGALILWICTIVFFTFRYLVYKNTLRKDPSLRNAVNDERVKLNWFKAYRVAFFTVVFLQGLMLFIQFVEGFVGPMYLILPQPYLAIFLAILSLVGAFLYFNREAQDG